MEDVSSPAVPKPVLTPEDLGRIRGCEFYLKSKEIIKSAEDYREYEVGTAVHIVNKNSNKMISSGYSDDSSPDKYIIVQNDNGFVFVKRINANGKPGAAITCVTIDYPSSNYELRVDDGYVESMLLDTQASYDPTTDAKNLARRKNKASRENGKKRIVFNTATESYNYLKTIKVGDIFFDTDYSYGGSYTEYFVDTIEKRPAVPSPQGSWRRYGDDDYITLGFAEVIVVHLKVKSSSKKYSYDRKLTYKELSKENYAQYNFLFKSKPISPEDLAQ